MADDITDDAEPAEDTAPKKSKLPLIMAVLGLFLGGGGFYAVYSGMILSPPTEEELAAAEEAAAEESVPLPKVAFVPVPPIIINVQGSTTSRHLKFLAQLEVNGGAEDEVTDVLPRIVDVMNGYLRAVDLGTLEERSALVQIRAQLLRRIQVVTGQGRVRDLLIMEFVLS